MVFTAFALCQNRCSVLEKGLDEDQCCGLYRRTDAGIHMAWLCNLKWEKEQNIHLLAVNTDKLTFNSTHRKKEHSPCVCEEAFHPLNSPLVVVHGVVALFDHPLPIPPLAHVLTSLSLPLYQTGLQNKQTGSQDLTHFCDFSTTGFFFESLPYGLLKGCRFKALCISFLFNSRLYIYLLYTVYK